MDDDVVDDDDDNNDDDDDDNNNNNNNTLFFKLELKICVFQNDKSRKLFSGLLHRVKSHRFSNYQGGKR